MNKAPFDRIEDEIIIAGIDEGGDVVSKIFVYILVVLLIILKIWIQNIGHKSKKHHVVKK